MFSVLALLPTLANWIVPVLVSVPVVTVRVLDVVLLVLSVKMMVPALVNALATVSVDTFELVDDASSFNVAPEALVKLFAVSFENALVPLTVNVPDVLVTVPVKPVDVAVIDPKLVKVPAPPRELLLIVLAPARFKLASNVAVPSVTAPMV